MTIFVTSMKQERNTFESFEIKYGRPKAKPRDYYESELYKAPKIGLRRYKMIFKVFSYGYVSDPRISNGSLLNLKHLKGEPL